MMKIKSRAPRGGKGGVRITDSRKNFSQFTDSRKNFLPFTDSRKNLSQFTDSWRRFLPVDGNGLLDSKNRNPNNPSL